jgi:hypothetical protein
MPPSSSAIASPFRSLNWAERETALASAIPPAPQPTKHPCRQRGGCHPGKNDATGHPRRICLDYCPANKTPNKDKGLDEPDPLRTLANGDCEPSKKRRGWDSILKQVCTSWDGLGQFLVQSHNEISHNISHNETRFNDPDWDLLVQNRPELDG